VGETLVQGIMGIEKELEVEITRVGPKGFSSVDQGPRHRPCTLPVRTWCRSGVVLSAQRPGVSVAATVATPTPVPTDNDAMPPRRETPRDSLLSDRIHPPGPKSP
jgi:hypothetical protein